MTMRNSTMIPFANKFMLSQLRTNMKLWNIDFFFYSFVGYLILTAKNVCLGEWILHEQFFEIE